MLLPGQREGKRSMTELNGIYCVYETDQGYNSLNYNNWENILQFLTRFKGNG